jgi:hypothetical protein
VGHNTIRAVVNLSACNRALGHLVKCVNEGPDTGNEPILPFYHSVLGVDRKGESHFHNRLQPTLGVRGSRHFSEQLEETINCVFSGDYIYFQENNFIICITINS